jgi:hypothetical protein
MDQFYFESGYIADDYYAYQAEATATLSSATSLSAELTDTNLSYFAPDYIATDYFETTIREAIAITGMAFSVSAELTDTNESYFVPQYIATDYFEIPVGITEEAAAAFTTTTSITAAVGRIVSSQIALTSTGTYVLTARVNKSTDISLSSQFAQTATASRTQTTAVALASEFTSSITAARTRTGSAAATSQFAQSTIGSTAKTSAVALNNFAAVNAQLSGLKQGKADLSSLTPDPATPSSGSDTGMLPFGAIAYITKAFNAILESSTTQTASVRKTASAQLAAQSQFTQTAQAFRIKQFTITVSSLFTPSVSANALINQLSIMEASASMSITAQATKVAASALSVQASQNTANIRIRFSDSQVSSQFSSSATATKQFADAVITATVAFTQTASIAKTAGLQSSLSANFTQSTSASKTFGYSAALASQFSQSTQAAKTFGYSASLTSEFAQTAAVARTRNLDVAVVSQSSVNAIPFRIIQGAVSITGAFTPTLTANVQRAGVALLETASTFQISAVANRSITLALSNIGNLNAQAAKTVGYNSTVSATAVLASSARKTASTSSTLTSQFTISINALSVQFAQAALSSSASMLTVGKSRLERPLTPVINPVGENTSVVSNPNKFGGASLAVSSGSYLRYYADEFTIPQLFVSNGARQELIIEFWYNPPSKAGRPILQYINGSTVYWTIFDEGSFQYLDSGNITRTKTPSVGATNNQFNHLLYAMDASGNFSIYVNGTRRHNSSTNQEFNDNTAGVGFLQIGQLTGGAVGYVDELRVITGPAGTVSALGYNISLTTITQPSGQFANTSTTRFLGHYNIDLRDDAATLVSPTPALTSSFTLTATAQELSSSQANLSSISTISALLVVKRSAASAITSTATQTAITTRIKPLASDISSQASVAALVGKIVPAASAFTATSTQTAQVLRIRTNVIAITSAFTPTLTADVFKNHVASLTATSAVSALISKTLNAASAVSAAATLSATATRLATTLITLSSQAALTSNSGKLKTANVNITGVFNASIGVQYFEGTSLMAAAAATMTVSARKTARITRTLSSAATLTATAFNAVHDPGPVLIPHDRALFHFDTTSSYVDSYGGTHSFTGISWKGSFNLESPKFGSYAVKNPSTSFQGVISNFPVGSGTDNFTIDWQWRPYADFKFTATQNQYKSIVRIYNDSDQQPIHLEYRNDSSGTTALRFRLNNNVVSLSPVANRGPTPGAGLDPYVSTDWHHVALQRSGSNLTLWFNGVNVLTVSGFTNSINNKSTWGYTVNTVDFSVSTTFQVIDELRIYDSAEYSGTFSPPTSAYPTVIEYYNEKNGYALIESRASLAVSAVTVVFIEATIVQGQFTSSTQGSRIRFGVTNATSSSTLTAAARKTVRGAAALTSAFATSNNVNRIKPFAAAISANASLSAIGSPVRIIASQLSSEFTLSALADKRTGIVAAITSTGSIAVDNVRVRDVSTAFTSIASNLTAAFKNARGTILLESQFTSSIQAQKITDRPQSFVSAFTQSAVARKTARGASTITSSVTMSVIGVRVRRQAAALSSSLTSVITTNNSKIVRTASAVLVETSQTTLNTRTRGITKTLTSTTALTCVFQIIITASAALNSQFTGLFIFGKRVNAAATLQSQGFQLTAGDIINFEPSLTYTIPEETRVLLVRMESREYIIEQETRQLILLEG